MLYSKSTGGFYDQAVHGDAVPADCVAIDQVLYASLIEGQAAGKRISADEGGLPILVDPPAPTDAEIETHKIAVVQRHMDEAARALRYDDIATAVTYAEEPTVPKFQAEGRAFREWRSAAWARCYEILADVTAGERPVPTDAALLSELPQLVLPQDAPAVGA